MGPRWLANLFRLLHVVDDGSPDSVAYRESVLYELGDTVGSERARYRVEYLRVPPDVRLAAPPDVIAPAAAVNTVAGTLVSVAVSPFLDGEDRLVTALLPRVEFPEMGAGGVPTQVTFDTHLVFSPDDPHVVASGIADPAGPHGFAPTRCTAGRTEWDRDADGSYPADFPGGLFRRWSDILQDEAGLRVFHPTEKVTTPARFRESFEIRADGVFIDFVLAPDDAVVPVAGQWRTTGPFTLDVGNFEDAGAAPRTLEVAYFETDVLKIRPS